MKNRLEKPGHGRLGNAIAAVGSAAMLIGSASADLNLGANDVDVLAGLSTDVNGNKVISVDTMWTADKTYIVTDRLFVTDGAKLSIEAGTKIYSVLDDGGTDADASDDFFGALIVTRGSMIEATGTCEAPIIFDAVDNLEAARGSDVDGNGSVATALTRRDASKWGGIIILGSATVSRYDSSGLVGEGQIEGFSTATNPTNDLDNDGRVDIVEYGGGTSPTDNDNSGIFRYVSIRHGGRTFVTGSEINGLTLGGVGSGTEIHHVEVYANSDDGIEFFGGTVSTSHMVMAYNFDDGFDFDEGQSGEHQYWLVIQDHAPLSGADNGGEWDGTGGSRAVTNILSTPKLFNLTYVGPGTNGGTSLGNDKGNNAMFLDDFFAGEVYNSVFTEFSDYLIALSTTAEDGETFRFRNNVIGEFGQYDGSDFLTVLNGPAQTIFASFDGSGEVFDDFGEPANGNSAPGTDPMFTSLVLGSEYDLRPAAGSPLLSGATTAAAVGASSFIEDSGYRGAFSADTNWASECGWTALSQTITMPAGEAAPAIQVTSSSFDGTTFTIEFVAEPGSSYKVTQSGSLDGFTTDVPGATLFDAPAAGSISFDPPAATKLFFRVEPLVIDVN